MLTDTTRSPYAETARPPLRQVRTARLSARKLDQLTKGSIPPKLHPFERDFHYSVRIRSAVILVALSGVVGLVLSVVVAMGATAGVVAVNRGLAVSSTVPTTIRAAH